MGKVSKNKNLENPIKAVSEKNDSGKVVKKYKKKFHQPPKKNPGTSVKLPVAPEEISSNWKTLLKTLESEKASKPPPPKKFFRRPKLDKNATKSSTEKKKHVPTEVVVEMKKKPEIWFDDVDEFLLDPEDRPSQHANDSLGVQAGGQKTTLVKETSFKGPTRIIAMDCEMVGVGYGGKDSVLARVSIVNHFGHCIYDKYVKPREKVTDYRTAVSGIRPQNLENAEDFQVVQKEVSDLMKDRILVGHAIKHDLKVLFLDHPRKMIRDTSTYKYFRNSFGGKTPSLKRLTERMLGVTVQEGEHSSVQDAQAAMRLYTMFRKQWENDIEARRHKNDVAKNSKQTSAPKPDHKIASSSNAKPKILTKSVLKPSASMGRQYYSDSD